MVLSDKDRINNIKLFKTKSDKIIRIYNPMDLIPLSNKINYLIENPDKRQEMSDNTYRDKDKLKMENIIKEWEKIL